MDDIVTFYVDSQFSNSAHTTIDCDDLQKKTYTLYTRTSHTNANVKGKNNNSNKDHDDDDDNNNNN